jgi:hypothetical protein
MSGHPLFRESVRRQSERNPHKQQSTDQNYEDPLLIICLLR